MKNVQVLLKQRPRGAVDQSCFELFTSESSPPGQGQVLVRNIYLSCDPYMRGQFSDAHGYKTAFELNQPVPARVVGEVVESASERFKPGDFVWGFMAWEQFSVVEADALRRVDPGLGPISHAISVLGMPGLTAYVGVRRIGKPAAGETVFVSAASGAVGQVAGQLARLAGARVVGSAGSERKIAHLTDTLGFDAAVNYRTESSLDEALARTCPDGIDFYFDNVGGATLNAVLGRLAPGARIAVCGQISQYDLAPGSGDAITRFGAILGARALVRGFSVRDHMHLFDEAIAEIAALMQAGRLRFTDDIIVGIENTPQAFMGMMRGDNLGKRLVRIAADPAPGTA